MIKASARKDGYSSWCKSCAHLAGVRRREARKLSFSGPTLSEKFCPDCAQTKAASDFPLSRGCPTGLSNYCKPCSVAKVRMRKTGYTSEDYSTAFEEQRGKCAICGDHRRTLVADHHHQSRTKRQLLCTTCNSGIGMLKDDPAVLVLAAHYLVRHGSAFPTDQVEDIIKLRE